nr:glycosyltransferase family 2 protein [uncultured Flavobacterium sp.]
MLSILIPTYNYNTYPLVRELYNQCIKIKDLHFEIIVNDDASKQNFDNELITKIPNCFYFKQATNQGLSASRNFLIQQATQDWCLFLDDDIWPTSNTFVLNYLKAIEKNKKSSVFFGGLQYTKQRPKENELLRWLYGKKHEALPYKKRIREKPNHFLSSNTLINQSVFDKVSYANEINSYGYEDLIFNIKVIENNINVLQVDNPVFHEKLDTSEIFLTKTEKALENLSKAIDMKILEKNTTGISKLESVLRKIYLKKIFVFIFNIFKPHIKNRLIGKNTNLNLFNLYRLGYFCSHHK